MERFLSSILAFMTLALLGHQAATATTYNCAGLTDTYLDQGSPDINYGADTDMTVSGNSAGAAVCRGIIRLNTPSFVEAGQIQNATLYLYGKTGSSPAIDIYALTTNCYEKHHDDPQGKHIDGATWNIRGKAGPAQYYWTNPGAEGDYDTNISSSGTIASGWNSIDVTTLLTGNLDLVRRFGMLIKVSDEEVDVNQTIGSLKDIANAPYLELEVDLGLAGETYLCPNIADIYLDEGYPDANFNHKVRALLATDTIHHYGIARGLFKFEIPDSVNASSIQSAALNLSGSIHTGGGAGGDVFLYALNTSFDEDTDTWNTLAGGDYDTCVGSGGTLPGTNDWETAIDVTTFLTGNLDKVRDNGMVLMFQDEYQTPSIHQNIASRECFDAEDFSAYLKITYSTVWYVDNDPPSGDGSSWEEAFATIQEAIDASGAGDEIWVKTATYVLATQINVDEVVSIYGGFTGTETLLEQRDWETNVTTVDGNNTTRCVYITSDASIDGLTIVNGQTSDKGAGLWNGECGVYETNLTVTNCTFLNNQSTAYHAGAIFNDDGYITVSKCIFEGNTANNKGGAILNYGDSMTIVDCEFIGNSSPNGGALFLDDDNIENTVTGCKFTGNISDQDGGAMIVDSDATISDCSFEDNTVGRYGTVATYGDWDKTITFTNCLFINNETQNGGGICISGSQGDLGTIMIVNCTFSENTATGTGGGVGGDIFLYALNAPFDEETDSWNTLTGGDHDTSVSSSGTLPAGNDWDTTIDVTTLLSGNIEKVRDNGMILLSQDEQQLPSVHQNMASRECYDDGDFSAYLEIVSTDPGEPDLIVSVKSEEWIDPESGTYRINYTVDNQGGTAAGQAPLA